HTRFSRDWSSDVCSSDLRRARRQIRAQRGDDILRFLVEHDVVVQSADVLPYRRRQQDDRRQEQEMRYRKKAGPDCIAAQIACARSEERRVGKECRSGWWK